MATLKTILTRATTELAGKGIPSPQLDARVLLEHAVQKDGTYIFAHGNALITNADYAKFRRYIRRRKSGEPVAYITGHKEFYGLDFIVNKNVLTPRPETEQLVEQAIAYCKSLIANRQTDNNKEKAISNKQLAICDVGTGSGNIIVSLAVELSKQSAISDQQSALYASDISKKALGVAKKNAQKHEVADHIKFYHSDLFANRRLPKSFDIIIANLPYVPSEDLLHASCFMLHEPKGAIFAGRNGTDVVMRFLKEAKSRLKPGGVILIELDPRNALEIKGQVQKDYPKTKIELKKDLAKFNRYLIINS